MLILITMLRWTFDFIQNTSVDGLAVSGCWLKEFVLRDGILAGAHNTRTINVFHGAIAQNKPGFLQRKKPLLSVVKT